MEFHASHPIFIFLHVPLLHLILQIIVLTLAKQLISFYFVEIYTSCEFQV